MSNKESGKVHTTWCDMGGKIVDRTASSVDVEDREPAVVEHETRQRFGEYLLGAYERDCSLLAYEIHDGMVQHAIGAQMRLQMLLATDNTLAENVRREVEVSLGLIEKSIEEARRLVRGLGPPVMSEFGIVSALQHLIDELPAGGPSVDWECDGQFGRLDNLLESCIFRIVQEALTNARRHSQSDRIAVRVARIGDVIRLEIRDWGIGFDTTHVAPDRYGLQSMRERTRLLGGWIRIESGPGKGTRVFVELPLTRAPGQEAQDSNGSYE